MILSLETLGQELIFGRGSMRVVVQGAAAEAPAGVEVLRGIEVDHWSDLCLGHVLDPDPHPQSRLQGQDHDRGLHHHTRCYQEVLDIPPKRRGSLVLLPQNQSYLYLGCWFKLF